MSIDFPSKLAPVVLFTYNRLWHTRQTVAALKANELASESELIIFSDGPKPGENPGPVDDVRRYLRTITGFKRVEINEHPGNNGLAKNIIEGVTRVIHRYGTVIVLEDDIATSPRFLRFCNEALDLYKNEPGVGMIHAHIYDIQGLPDLFFTHKAGCLGWATWKRAWDEVSFDGPLLLRELKQKNLCRTFDVNGSYPYCKLLKNQIKGKNNSWAVRMYASFLLKNRLTFNVGRSLTTHLGFDTGTHCRGAAEASPLDGIIAPLPPRCARIPVTEDPEAIRAIERFYRRRRILRVARMVRSAWLDVRRSLHGLLSRLARRTGWLKAVKRTLRPPPRPEARRITPVSSAFGADRGTPIDRVYIEAFLDQNRALITGAVLEIAERTYADRFGSGVSRCDVLHAAPGNFAATLVGDLTRPDSLPEHAFDCVICTQTLNFIYDFHAAIGGLRHLLREGGTALVTVAGICQVSRYDMDRWGDYWRFTPLAMERAFTDVFGEGHATVKGWGNVLAAKAFLDGLAAEDVPRSDLMHMDRDYPVVITVAVRK